MIPTFTNKIKENLLTDFLGLNLVIALINYPELGLTDSITNEQLNLRSNLTLDNISEYEIGKFSLNGYKRQIVNFNSSLISGENVKQVITTVEFEANGADFEPATHIIAIQGARLSNAEPENGNNRGDGQGTIIYVEPINNAPLVVAENTVFEYTATFISSIGFI